MKGSGQGEVKWESILEKHLLCEVNNRSDENKRKVRSKEGYREVIRKRNCVIILRMLYSKRKSVYCYKVTCYKLTKYYMVISFSYDLF